MLNRILSKIRTDRYFSSWAILLIDLAVSVTSSLFVVLLYKSLLWRHSPGPRFTVGWIAAAAVTSLALFLALHTYKSIIRHSSLREAGQLCMAVAGKEILMLIVLLANNSLRGVQPLPVWIVFMDFLTSFGALVAVRVAMIAGYDVVCRRRHGRSPRQRVLIYGTSEKSVSQVMRLRNSTHYQVAGFITFGKRQKGHTIAGLRVFYFETAENIGFLQRHFDIDAVLFAYYTDAQLERDRLLAYCQQCRLKSLIAPSIDEITDDAAIQRPMRDIRIEDLLGRPEIEISLDEIRSTMEGKTILVTGAAGSIGSELCRQLARFGVGHLIMFDNAETPLHTLRLEFADTMPGVRFTTIVGDVRTLSRLDYVFRKYRPQTVFHAAAYKHVPLMEENPCEAVAVNVGGSRNVADKCIEYDVEKMVMISTDKAVNPTNIMGCTKRLAEIYVQSLGLAVAAGRVAGRTKFITTRFGNVLGSNGSVVPIFREQIRRGGPVRVTHPDIIRYFMLIPEACQLVLEAATIGHGGEIFVFDMGEPVRIADLAKKMISISGRRDIRIEYTGLRAGEKLYEEVLTAEETVLPTSHKKIKIARVREYDFAEASSRIGALIETARTYDAAKTVEMMGDIVPEYKPLKS